MASPNVSKIIRAPGRLIVNPTDLNSPPAFGGIEIGIHRDIEMRFNQQYYWIFAEEYSTSVDAISCPDEAEIRAYARGMDASGIQYMFPSTSAGAMGDRVIQDFDFTGGVRAGALLTEVFTNMSLMFAPKDYDRHPFVIFHRVIPWLDEAAAMPLSRVEELSYAVAFRALPDVSGKSYTIGRRGSISL